MKTLVVLALVLHSVSYSQWTREDEIQTVTFQVLNFADAYTTLRGLEHPNVREGNPLIGQSKHSVILYLGLLSILEPFIFSHIPAPERRWMRYAILSVKIFAVGNNVSLLIRLQI